MDNNRDLFAGLVLELRRGTIVLCVLSQLNEPTYGYNLVNILAEKGIIIEANTVYPLLRRLESQGVLISTWETSGPKPRKYYETTADGKKLFVALKNHWVGMVKNMNNLWEVE